MAVFDGLPIKNNWNALRELGSGGQGKVFFARKFPPRSELDSIDRRFRERIGAFTTIQLIEYFSALPSGAMKILNSPDAAVNSEKARDRLRREIEVLSMVRHPNILRILDSDQEFSWFVAEYFQRGTLASQLAITRGDVVASIRVLRDVVEAVSALHAQSVIHRDIKPENLFLADDGRLVLGDFGLAHPADADRLTRTMENAGTRRYMPAWAMDHRLTIVPPEFDVFCLAKLLWVLVAGREPFPLHYWSKQEDNLEKLLPQVAGVDRVNAILKKCLTDSIDSQEIRTANELLAELDKVSNALRKDNSGRVRQLPHSVFPGKWSLVFEGSSSGTEEFVIDPEDRYVINGEPIFATRVIAQPLSTTVVFEKKRLSRDQVFIELLELKDATTRIGHDHLGNRVTYQRLGTSSESKRK